MIPSDIKKHIDAELAKPVPEEAKLRINSLDELYIAAFNKGAEALWKILLDEGLLLPYFNPRNDEE